MRTIDSVRANFIIPVILLMSALSIAACSSTSQLNQEKPDASTDYENKEELTELFYARQDSARMNFTEADVEFMTGMIAHHAQALIMSELAPGNNASPAIQTLAARIINAQKDEIALMQQWLRDRDQPVPEIHIDGLKLMIHGLGDHHHKMDHTTMRGMLSPEQLKELSEAKGKEFDRLFLTYMIDHHEGAVYMVEKLFNTDGAGQDEGAFRLASDIQVDQRTEIARMQSMLDAMSDNSD